jgi:hypothetical protein
MGMKGGRGGAHKVPIEERREDEGLNRCTNEERKVEDHRKGVVAARWDGKKQHIDI